ncbi:MAG: arginine N-succinyltransferase [Candidatus Sphingomonas colombiensis]|nr:arginine N-succinyltransferase [Sphingomonas sp.]WEK42000.1 MAG: arginine N-succinyltransferase [Sphingomonas sp.]
MWIVRPVKTDDIDALFALAEALGPGMTTFPANRDTLSAKIEAAVASFAGTASRQDAQYLMALEDAETGTLLGVSAVYPQIGHPFGFFSYHVDRLVNHSSQIGFDLDCTVLNLSNAYTGLTEIGTLAVRPDLRKGGAGRLLARARYMLMACFPALFADRVIAEMRGWQNQQGDNPFWSAVGEKFFRMDFASADRVSATKGAEFIANLMPKFPIYLDLLPEDARACIGKPHDTSAIAMAMLTEEGFRFENYIDVFDAGPQVIAPLARIRTVADSAEAALRIGSPDPLAAERLVASTRLGDFRIVRVKAAVDDDGLVVSAEAAAALKCSAGDLVRHVTAGK